MIFETSTEKDIPELCELIETCYRGEAARKGWTNESDIIDGNRTSAARLLEEISAPGAKYLKYTNEDGKIVGCLYTRHDAKENRFFIGGLGVHPSIQSGGLGQKFMTAAEDMARNAGCTKICMRVLTARTDLIAWYEKIGYKQVVGENIPFPDGFGRAKRHLELGFWEKPIYQTRAKL